MIRPPCFATAEREDAIFPYGFHVLLGGRPRPPPDSLIREKRSAFLRVHLIRLRSRFAAFPSEGKARITRTDRRGGYDPPAMLRNCGTGRCDLPLLGFMFCRGLTTSLHRQIARDLTRDLFARKRAKPFGFALSVCRVNCSLLCTPAPPASRYRWPRRSSSHSLWRLSSSASDTRTTSGTPRSACMYSLSANSSCRRCMPR